jgi:hypothetical protein
MTQLNQQTVKITQQNALNAKSEQRRLSFARRQDSALESQIGTLRMSLRDICRRYGTRLRAPVQEDQTTRYRRLAPPSPGEISRHHAELSGS